MVKLDELPFDLLAAVGWYLSGDQAGRIASTSSRLRNAMDCENAWRQRCSAGRTLTCSLVVQQRVDGVQHCPDGDPQGINVMRLLSEHDVRWIESNRAKRGISWKQIYLELRSPYEETASEVIEKGVFASSEDHVEQTIECTLESGTASFWSSTGRPDSGQVELLVYALDGPCAVSRVMVVPFLAFFQRGRPCFGPQRIRISLTLDEDGNHVLYRSPDFAVDNTPDRHVLELNADFAWGKYLHLELQGLCQTQEIDDAFYCCLERVSAYGVPLAQFPILIMHLSRESIIAKDCTGTLECQAIDEAVSYILRSAILEKSNSDYTLLADAVEGIRRRLRPLCRDRIVQRVRKSNRKCQLAFFDILIGQYSSSFGSGANLSGLTEAELIFYYEQSLHEDCPLEIRRELLSQLSSDAIFMTFPLRCREALGQITHDQRSLMSATISLYAAARAPHRIIDCLRDHVATGNEVRLLVEQCIHLGVMLDVASTYKCLLLRLRDMEVAIIFVISAEAAGLIHLAEAAELLRVEAHNEEELREHLEEILGDAMETEARRVYLGVA